MNTKILQETLDIDKWLNSEKLRRDLCGEYDYCAYCKNESEYPCALAYIRMEEYEKSVIVEDPKKALNEIAATLDKVKTPPNTKRHIKTFAEKLAETKSGQRENLKRIEEIFNSIGAKRNLTQKYVNFRLNKKLVGLVSLNRGCLRLQLALPPEDYDYRKFPHDDYSNKKCYLKVPFSMKIQSALSLKRARILIIDAAEKNQDSSSKNFKSY